MWSLNRPSAAPLAADRLIVRPVPTGSDGINFTLIWKLYRGQLAELTAAVDRELEVRQRFMHQRQGNNRTNAL